MFRNFIHLNFTFNKIFFCLQLLKKNLAFKLFFTYLVPVYGIRTYQSWVLLFYFSLIVQFSSAQFSHSAVSDSLWHHESQHTRPPSPSPTLGVHSNSCPLSQWCHTAISSSVVPFSTCPQSLPASGSFPMSQLFELIVILNQNNLKLFINLK